MGDKAKLAKPSFMKGMIGLVRSLAISCLASRLSLPENHFFNEGESKAYH